MVKHCAFGLCKSDTRYHPEKVFVPFVKPNQDLARAKRWIHLCGRKDFHIWNITKDTYICEDHFPRGENLNPRENMALEPYLQANESKIKALAEKRSHQGSQAKTEETLEETKDAGGSQDATHFVDLDLNLASLSKVTYSSTTRRPISFFVPVTVPLRLGDKIDISDHDSKTLVSQGTQTVGMPQLPLLKKVLKKPAFKIKAPISSFLLEFERRATLYTGLNKEQRDSLWNFLGEARDRLNLIGYKPPKLNSALTNLSVECQFLMTLVILRQNEPFNKIAVTYQIDSTTVSRVFKTWVQFMYCKFMDLQEAMFVKRRDIYKPLPQAFQNNLLRNTRVVIDCTEIIVESSENYKQQGNTYSSYKSRTTAKVLIGTLPSGAACFISHAFEGSISDRQIVIQSGFLDFIEPGDVVLADRGFNVEDLLLEKGASLVIPPFLKGRPSFTLAETRQTKLIARARIHIERFNQRVKLFRFLSGPISHFHFPILSQVVYICCCLANFSPLLVKK